MRRGRKKKDERALYLECARGMLRAGAKDYEVAMILDVHRATLSRWRRAGWLR